MWCRPTENEAQYIYMQNMSGLFAWHLPISVLRQLLQIRRLVPTVTFQTLAVALVNQRLDYGNCTLVGIPAYLMRRLPSRCGTAHLRSSGHVTDALVSLHWLRVPERIQFKIAVLTYRVLHGDAPRCLGPFTSTADVPGRRELRSAGTNRLVASK